jgi:hypothetical protein
VQYPNGMREPNAASNQADLEALNALQADASELGRIENQLDRFNMGRSDLLAQKGGPRHPWVFLCESLGW